MFEEQVRHGVELLDQEYPGWRAKIDLTKLDLGDYDYCILGQLYGDFGQGKAALTLIAPAEYGFDTLSSHRGAAYQELTELWRQACSNG